MKWTVVLERSADLMQYTEPDQRDRSVTADRIYVAVGVEADTKVQAITAAVEEAMNADKQDIANNEDAADFDHTLEDYSLVVLFEGEHHPAMFGFQL